MKNSLLSLFGLVKRGLTASNWMDTVLEVFFLTLSLLASLLGEVKQKALGKNQKILKSNSAARLQSF